MPEPSIDTDVETWLRAVAAELTDPQPRECLLCFVHRMLGAFGCRTTLRFATHYRDLRAPRAVALERRLGEKGGFCDCEIFLNGWTAAPHLWTPEVAVEHDGWTEVLEEPEPPSSMPGCLGARPGATRPCGLWQARRRR